MKKIIIVLALILLGGYFAYPEIQGKMNEAKLKRENPNAEIIGGADGPTQIYTEKNNEIEDATIIGAVINSKGFSGDKLVLDINTYSNVKSLMKSTYILGFEDENGNEIKELKVRINSSEPEDHQNVREEIGGIDKYDKVIIFLKQVEVVENNDYTSYLSPIQNLTIEK